MLLRNALWGFPGIGLEIKTNVDAALTFTAGPRVRTASSVTDAAQPTA